MKNLLLTLFSIMAIACLDAQTVLSTSLVKMVNGDTIFQGTVADITASIDVHQAGTANQLVVTNDAGTSLENAGLSTGTAGTDFNIDQTGANIVINLPDASVTDRGAVTTGAQSYLGLKDFTGGSKHTGAATSPAIELDGVSRVQLHNITANTTLTAIHSHLNLDSSGGVFTVTLPPLSTSIEWVYTFNCVDCPSIVTIDPNAAETFIDGAGQKLIVGDGSGLKVHGVSGSWSFMAQ